MTGGRVDRLRKASGGPVPAAIVWRAPDAIPLQHLARDQIGVADGHREAPLSRGVHIRATRFATPRKATYRTMARMVAVSIASSG